MFFDILNKALYFPSDVRISLELKSLLTELLKKSPHSRLGCSNGMLEVFNHPWCKKTKLIDVMHKNLKPAISPNSFKMYFEEFTKKEQAIINGNFLIKKFSMKFPSKETPSLWTFTMNTSLSRSLCLQDKPQRFTCHKIT